METLTNPHNTTFGLTTQFNSAGTWVPWTKPRNCMFIYILTIGAGGGGGAGATPASGAGAKYGGRGGGSGAMRRSFFLAPTLPDTLWVYVGRGGAGGAGLGGNGASGEATLVGAEPTTDVSMLVSAANPGVGGDYGAAAAGGGTGGTAANFGTECNLGGPFFGIEAISTIAQINEYAFIAGNASTAVSASAYSARAALGGSTITMAGGSGGAWSGSVQRAGEGYAASTNGIIPAIPGGTTGGGRGQDGYVRAWQPLILTGASGGGCNSGGNGGDGGHGAIGGGGGGGGCGNNGDGSGGVGGNGGQGYVLIAAR